MKHVVVGLFVVLVVGAGSASPAERHLFRPPDTLLFEVLGADPTACSATQSGQFEDHVAVRCATLAESFKSLKKIWRKAIRGGGLSRSVQWDEGPWKKVGGTGRQAHAFHDETPVEITFDESTGALTVSWPESYPGCHAGFEAIWFARSDDILSPESKERVGPAFPEEARIQRASGSVIGSFVLDEEGRVADICVLGTNPPNVGFEQASVQALSDSSFKPATRNGRPVAIIVNFVHTYEVNLTGSYTSPLLKNYFDSVRAPDDPDR